MIEKLTFIASYKSQFFDDLDLLIFDFCCVDKQAHPNNCKFIFQGSGFSKFINGLVSPEKKIYWISCAIWKKIPGVNKKWSGISRDDQEKIMWNFQPWVLVFALQWVERNVEFPVEASSSSVILKGKVTNQKIAGVFFKKVCPQPPPPPPYGFMAFFLK